MSIPFIDAIRGYLQGDGAVILPEMELTLFGLAVLLIGFSLDESVENNWLWKLLFKNFYAKAALAGTLFSGFTLWKLRGAVAGSARGYLPGFLVCGGGFVLSLFRNTFPGSHRARDSAVREIPGHRRGAGGGILRASALCLCRDDVHGLGR